MPTCRQMSAGFILRIGLAIIASFSEPPLTKGRGALRKYACGIFLAKAGSKLCFLAPSDEGAVERM